MATDKTTVDFLLEQMALAGVVTARKMFGEYGVYCDGRFVALVCDDELFIKPTEAGKAFVGEYEEIPPYPGAKPWMRIDGGMWEERDWLSEVIRITAASVPLPAPKAQRSTR